MTSLAPETASALLTKWQGSPKAFFDDQLGVPAIWRMQDEVLQAVPQAMADRKPIYLASGHSLGKDWLTAGLGLWFLHSFSPSIVILTAPTDRQVKKIMWGETLRHWRNRKLDLGGRAFANPYIEIDKTNWYLIGFTTKETGASAAGGGGKFQGFHAPNVCVIVSEAQAVEDVVFDQIDAVTTPERVLVIVIGNPTRATGRFAKGLKDKGRNIVFNFSCLENPNYLQRRTVIPGLASYEWVEDKRSRWGEDDPRWFGRVLGRTPATSLNNVFPEALVHLMQARHDRMPESLNRGVAVDPAGEGIDENVITSGINGKPADTFAQTVVPPSSLALRALSMCRDIGGHFIVVDCDGVGIGTYQELMKLNPALTRGVVIVKFHGSAPIVKEDAKTSVGDVIVKEGEAYANLRAKAAFVAQDRARRGAASLPPGDSELADDLQEETYFENRKGAIQLEEKADVKERLGRSPGRGDAWKMLQWAFEQNFARPLDAEAPPDTGVDRQGAGIPVNEQGLPVGAGLGGY